MIKFVLSQLRNNKTIIKFIASGGSATVVDFALLYYLHDILDLGLRISVTLAFAAAFFISFYLQKLWTFGNDSKKKTKKQMTMFLGVGVFNVAINAIAVPFLTYKLGIYYLISQAISGGTLSIGSFLMYKYVIFKTDHSDLRKKNLFLPDKFSGLRVLITSMEFDIQTRNIRETFRDQGNRVKVIALASNDDDYDGVYKIDRTRNSVSQWFEYFYHAYKISSWSDIVYLRGGLDNIIPTYLACRARHEGYIFEVTENCLFGEENNCGKQIKFVRNIKRNIAKNAKNVIIHNEEVKNNVLSWGVKEDRIILIGNQEIIKIADYIL